MDNKLLININYLIERSIKESTIPPEAHLEIEDAVKDAIEDKIIEKESEIHYIKSYLKRIIDNKIADYYRIKYRNKNIQRAAEPEFDNISDLSLPVHKLFEQKIQTENIFKERELRIASPEIEPGNLGFINSSLFELLENVKFNPVFEWLRTEFVKKNKSASENAKNLIMLWLIFRSFLGNEKGDNLFTIWAFVLMAKSEMRVPSKKKIESFQQKRRIYDIKNNTSGYGFKEISKIKDIKKTPSETRRLYTEEARIEISIKRKLDNMREGYTELERELSLRLMILKKVLRMKNEYRKK